MEALLALRLAPLGRQPGDQAPLHGRSLGRGGCDRRPLDRRLARRRRATTSSRSGGGCAGGSPWPGVTRPRRARGECELRSSSHEAAARLAAPDSDSRLSQPGALGGGATTAPRTLALELAELVPQSAAARCRTTGSRRLRSRWPASDSAAELEAIAESVPTATPWREGGLALGRGDAPAAAAIFGQMGARPFEAEAHLLAAKDGLPADLPAAIEFFREVGAVRWLRRGRAAAR